MGKLYGKTAVVTGGSSGIGLATARRFAREGATVFIMGRRQAHLDAAVAVIGGNVHAVQGDVAKLADLDRLYEAVAAGGHRVDVLFANAGAAIVGPLGAITEDDFDAIIDVNMRGTLFTVQKALPLFNDQGSIVMTGSIAGVKGRAGRSVYAASKAALRSFARTWATDLKDRGIRVNLISPGPTETAALASASEAMREALAAPILRGRLRQPDEIADAVLFLASRDSTFVNATELFADGGYAQV
ncbi:SDR family NAD(P)-dependent oxidoreductase [Paraburkholderia strydomiana]|uniref:SDR family NAD(P)-dependent oxidoreductase n=1 Tax=Paraburkholderia strydomiana TaxID=1245417 RepID=UPI001BE690AC|nr:SDR family oxidoreductase [Paraburkholderia strydomiana]MBT2792807.1 SDR family oxidoreductase [Paraburkholderia strydomiana]